MKVRFLADVDLNKVIVTGILRREPTVDFLTAQAAGLRGLKDPEVLSLAAKQKRVLVSHDAAPCPATSGTF
jgi:predicted nuclease of predicted toxin-antitoxin system